MKTTFRCSLAALALASLAAHADVSAPLPPNFAGEWAGITYGNGGEVYELQPYLFVNGLGGAEAAVTVAARTPLLDYSFGSFNLDAHTLVLQYAITNLSASESFNQLRFMVFANPDGDVFDYADRVSENWGAAQAGDPVRRETVALPVLDGSVTSFLLAGNLDDGPPGAACTGGAGCDASFALQWNAPLLDPGESFVLQLGLSDNGTALSSRSLVATALNSPDTVLTFSGTAQVTAVPEPTAWMLFGCGLIGLNGWLRRRR